MKSFAEYGQMAKDAIGNVPIFTTIPGGTFQISFLALHKACLEAGIDGLNYNPYGVVVGNDLYGGEERIELENFLQTVNDAEQTGGYTKLLWVNEFHHIQGEGDESYWEFPSEQVMREFLTILVNNGVRGFHFFLMAPGDPESTEQVGWYANLKNGIIGLITNVNVEEGAIDIPEYFKLEQNFPNPFNPVTTISFQLPKASFVKLSIYNLAGQLIETLLNENMNTGYHTITWNSKSIGSGVYFYRIKAGEYRETKKCLILK